jgi:hypothetical protein
MTVGFTRCAVESLKTHCCNAVTRHDAVYYLGWSGLGGRGGGGARTIGDGTVATWCVSQLPTVNKRLGYDLSRGF